MILDWHSRRVLSWRVSNTMEADFCVDALEEALERYGKPGIFKTGQGSQFTSEAFTEVLNKHDVRISMDGKGDYRCYSSKCLLFPVSCSCSDELHKPEQISDETLSRWTDSFKFSTVAVPANFHPLTGLLYEQRSRFSDP